MMGARGITRERAFILLSCAVAVSSIFVAASLWSQVATYREQVEALQSNLDILESSNEIYRLRVDELEDRVAELQFVPNRPDDFEIVFKYGVNARNVLDTREGTFTKDLILDPSITIELTLTELELAIIWTNIHINDFYELEEQDINRGYVVQPATTYVLIVHADGYPDREVSMNDITYNYNPSELRFFRIAWKIREIIESKPEYKALPEPRGGYA